MGIDGQAMELGNLTKGERGLYDELAAQPPNVLLSAAWFELCLGAPAPRPSFPTSTRLLNRALTSLQRLGLVIRIPSPDNSAWYWLAERWALLSPEVQCELAGLTYPARSRRGSFAVLLLGPTVFPEGARRAIFVPAEGLVAGMQSVRFDLEGRRLRKRTLKPAIPMESLRLVWEGRIRFVHLTFSQTPD